LSCLAAQRIDTLWAHRGFRVTERARAPASQRLWQACCFKWQLPGRWAVTIRGRLMAVSRDSLRSPIPAVGKRNPSRERRLTGAVANSHYRPTPEVHRSKFSRREWPVSGAQRTYAAAIHSATNSPKRTSNGLGRRQPGNGGANVCCLKNRTSGIDPHQTYTWLESGPST